MMCRPFAAIPIALALLLVTGIGCATRPLRSDTAALPEAADRGPIAATAERVRQAIVADPAFSQWLSGQVVQLTDNYFRAGVELDRFDRALETARSTMDTLGSQAYANLLALRAKRLAIQETVSQLHSGLLVAAATDSNAMRALQSLYRVLGEHSSQEVNRLALVDLVETLEDQRDDLIESGQTSTPTRQALSLDGFEKLRLSAEEQVRIATSPGFMGQFASPDRKIASTAISTEAAEIHAEIRATLSGESRGRGPQSVAKIMPGVGTSGNLTGEQFPPGVWALTFNDGPSKRHTPKILDELGQHRLKATFFVLAQSLQSMPTVAHSLRDLGHGLGNHSYTRAHLTGLGTLGLEHEIKASTEAQAEVWGARPRFFRVPFASGVQSARVREVIARENLVHVLWNVDSLDWQDRNPASVAQRTIRQMNIQRGGIILFHDIYPQSITAGAKVMEEITSRHLRAVTVPEMVDELNFAR